MAITASVALSQTPIAFNQKSVANVTINKSNAGNLTVVRLAPRILPTSGPNMEININGKFSALPQGFGQQFTVPGSGSVVVPVEYLLHSPQVVSNGNLSQSIGATYSIGCEVYLSDGSCTAATPATVTITPISAN